MRFLACGSGGWALGAESRDRAGTQQAPPPASGAIHCFLCPSCRFCPVRSEFSGAWPCCHRTAIPPILTDQSPWAGGGGPVEPPPGLAGGVGLNEAVAGPAGPSVYPGPSEVALGFSFRLDGPSRRRRWGAGAHSGPWSGSPWRLLVTNSPSLSGCWYPWQCYRAFLSPGLLGFQASGECQG